MDGGIRELHIPVRILGFLVASEDQLGATETRKFEGWTPIAKSGSEYEIEFDSK